MTVNKACWAQGRGLLRVLKSNQILQCYNCWLKIHFLFWCQKRGRQQDWHVTKPKMNPKNTWHPCELNPWTHLKRKWNTPNWLCLIDLCQDITTNLKPFLTMDVEQGIIFLRIKWEDKLDFCHRRTFLLCSHSLVWSKIMAAEIYLRQADN